MLAKNYLGRFSKKYREGGEVYNQMEVTKGVIGRRS